MHIQCNLTKGALIRGLQNRVHRDKGIIEVWIIFREELYRFDPVTIIDGIINYKIQWGDTDEPHHLKEGRGSLLNRYEYTTVSDSIQQYETILTR